MDYVIRTPEQLTPLLRAFRKARGESQADTAARLGVTQQALSALERDPSSAGIARLLQVLSALDVEIVLRERPATDASPPGSW